MQFVSRIFSQTWELFKRFWWEQELSLGVGISIVSLALLLRVVALSSGNIPFSFDHGKDSLAVMHMTLALSPKLIGPWTSIPGVFFGPGWYYLLAPGYLISFGHPLSAAWIMTFLVVIQVWLMYRWFGWAGSLISATAFSWMTISKSAWNPYPMTAVALLFFIILMDGKQQKWSYWHTAGLCFVAALGFHFSAAFAFFYLLIVPIVLILNKRLRHVKEWLVAAVSGFLPFLPQFIFELRNGFVQTHALIAYFSSNPEATGAKEFLGYLRVVLAEVALGIHPVSFFHEKGSLVGTVFWWSLIALLSVSVLKWLVSKERESFVLTKETLVFTGIPLVGLYFLHFNIWYVLSLIVPATLLAGWLIQRSTKVVQFLFVMLYVLGSILQMCSLILYEQPDWALQGSFLQPKLSAVSIIYEKSQGKPFAVYTFASDIYDYSQQYLFFWQHFSYGRPLPTEFTYQPGEISYAKEKPDLLGLAQVTTQAPERIFFWIHASKATIESGESQQLREWLGRQPKHTVIESIVVTPDLTIIVAQPELN